MAFWTKAGRRIGALGWHEIADQEMLDLLDGPPDWRGTTAHFRDYQWFIHDKIIEVPRVYVGAKMGLGKTGASLKAARTLIDTDGIKHVLVVAPQKVAEETWPMELRVWEFGRLFDFTVLTGDEEERRACLALPVPEITIVNRENLVWLYNYWGARKWPYDMLIYDEARRLSAAKKRTGKTTRQDGTVTGKNPTAFAYLTRIAHKFKRVVLLSGTTAPQGLIDIWGPMYIIDKGHRLGSSMTKYKERWFRPDRSGFGVEPLAHAEEEVMGLVKDVMFTLDDKDYLELPPLVVNNRYITLPPKVRDQYKKFENTLYLEEHDIEAVNSGVLTQKLLQLANGSVYNDEKTALPIHNLKTDELELIVQEAGGEPILIAYEFQFDIQRIKKRFPKFRVFGENKSDLRDWNLGRVPGLIVHPASAGHGLNFQYGGHIAVWYGLTSNLEWYQQMNKRLHRSGQKGEHVFLHQILARGTEDERQLKRLTTKGITQDRIEDLVRIRQEDIRATERFRMAA